jgi:DNA polymerase III epsilon subunit-like protein
MPMPPEAERVHGHSDAFLADKPLFHERAGELLEFLGDAQLVAHNAGFDMRFVNAELARIEPAADSHGARRRYRGDGAVQVPRITRQP